MRSALVVFLSLVVALSGHAAEIREFDIKTTERLGRELAQEANRPGHLTDKQRRARDTATAALKGRLFDIHYDYVVLNDPEHPGFLVYALAKGNKHGDVVLAGHFRVSVSADGARALRVDALSRSLMVKNPKAELPKGYSPVADVMSQIVSNTPIETVVYTNLTTGRPIFVVTMDRRLWLVNNGRITLDKKRIESERKH
jgi:hypothetical protein